MAAIAPAGDDAPGGREAKSDAIRAAGEDGGDGGRAKEGDRAENDRQHYRPDSFSRTAMRSRISARGAAAPSSFFSASS